MRSRGHSTAPGMWKPSGKPLLLSLIQGKNRQGTWGEMARDSDQNWSPDHAVSLLKLISA